ncbi:hypothetical protein ABQF34_16160 [Mycolicibacterium boenickei]
MAASVDVAARLDEGQAAVDTIAEYVWACHLLGFTHPDLTGYRYQVRDWYAAEDGLDLRMLDAEGAALTATAAAAEEALQLQSRNFQRLSESWQGTGAAASTDFLVRHANSAGRVTAGIHSAAATLARLRDGLWQAVDAKVAAALQIESRQAAQRGAWLAAARTVSTGVGDRAAASELVDTQVKPFVANDIGGDWLSAMRGATRAVADAYAEAIAALRAEAVPVFGIPGVLGPAWSPPDAVGGVSAAPAPSAPGLTAAPASAPSWPAPTPAPASAAIPAAMPAPEPAPIAPAAPPLEPTGPTPAPLSAMGQGLPSGGLPSLGGMPDIGSGLAGSGQQLADLFGGLLGSSADGLPDDMSDLTGEDVDDSDPEAGEDVGEDAGPESGDEADDAEDADDAEEGEEAEEGEPAEADDAVEVTEPQEMSTEPGPEVPAPVTPPPPVPEPVAEPLAAPTGETPCEIAADELPQAGP